MKKNFILPLAAILFLPLSVTSCTEEADGENIGEAASLLLDNDSVTLVQGHDITVNITSGNGDYSARSFDESVVTATVEGTAVTIHAMENSDLGEDDVLETTVLVLDGRKKVARVEVLVAKLWDLTVDVPEDGIDLFIGETRTVKILTGNGEYAVSATEGADKFVEISEIAGQSFTLTGLLETEDTPVQLTLTDSEGKTVTFPVVVNIVDLKLDSNQAEFTEPDASAQYITIEQGNGGYSFSYRTGDSEPVDDSPVVEATESGNLITLSPKAAGETTVIVTDQKGSCEEISVIVNPYELQLAQAKAQATALESALSRMEPLYQAGAVTQQDYEMTKAQKDAADAQLELAELQLSYAEVTAPKGGTVVMADSSEGSVASSEMPLAIIADLSRLVVDVPVGEKFYDDIALADPGSLSVEVYRPDGTLSSSASILSVSPYIDPTSKTFKVRVLLDEPVRIV